MTFYREAPIVTGVPPGPGGGHPPTRIEISVSVPGATTAAMAEFERAVQSYADLLNNESQKQELYLRPPGGQDLEITANAVVRAKRAMSRFGERAKPNSAETASLVGSPVFAGATGVMGSFLNSAVQIAAFAVLALLAFVCIVYTVLRRVYS